MTTTNEDYRRRSLYNSESSKKARAKAAPPGPVERLQKEHLNEKQELAAQHRKEVLALTSKLHAARSKDHKLLSGASPSDQWLAREKAKSDELEAVHKAARARLAEDHRKAMDHAMKTNPLD